MGGQRATPPGVLLMAIKDLTTSQISTVELALTAWVIRCNQQAKNMDDLAAKYERCGPAYTQKVKAARANAAASRNFVKEATETLETIKA